MQKSLVSWDKVIAKYLELMQGDPLEMMIIKHSKMQCQTVLSSCRIYEYGLNTDVNFVEEINLNHAINYQVGQLHEDSEETGKNATDINKS